MPDRAADMELNVPPIEISVVTDAFAHTMLPTPIVDTVAHPGARMSQRTESVVRSSRSISCARR